MSVRPGGERRALQAARGPLGGVPPCFSVHIGIWHVRGARGKRRVLQVDREPLGGGPYVGTGPHRYVACQTGQVGKGGCCK